MSRFLGPAPLPVRPPEQNSASERTRTSTVFRPRAPQARAATKITPRSRFPVLWTCLDSNQDEAGYEPAALAVELQVHDGAYGQAELTELTELTPPWSRRKLRFNSG
jgi:hypothetical protein